MRKKQTKPAYVTLVSVLLLSVAAVIIITTALTLSTDSLRKSQSETEEGSAQALVSTCAEQSLSQIRLNIEYVGNETLDLFGGSCSYTVINIDGGANKQIDITASFGDSVKELQIITSSLDPQIVIESWE